MVSNFLLENCTGPYTQTDKINKIHKYIDSGYNLLHYKIMGGFNLQITLYNF